MLAKNLELLVAAICKVIQTADSWSSKKVKKTGLAVGLYAKAAKTLSHKDSELNMGKTISETGVKLIKQIETAIEKDNTMSNLKGKVKEIKKIIEL